MLDPKHLDELSRRLADGLPSGLQTIKHDVEHNLRSSLEIALGKLNLVTREEFEVQQAVLLRTREKVRDLEKRVAELEARLSPASPDN